MRMLLSLMFFCLLCQVSSAQLSLGYFPFQSELSISTNSDRLIWGDCRLATNTFFGNVTTEPILMVNVKRKEWANFYGGLGMNLNFFNAVSNISIVNGYDLHFGTRAKPIKTIANLHFIFEISPYVNRSFDGGLLRTRLGIAYQFGKKKKGRSNR